MRKNAKTIIILSLITAIFLGISSSDESSFFNPLPFVLADAPPTFSSSTLDEGTGVFTITFLETIDATPTTDIDPTKIHIRETGRPSGGATLSASELTTTTNSTTITFTLSEVNRQTVIALTAPWITIDAGAVTDVDGNSFSSAFDLTNARNDGIFFTTTANTNPHDVRFSANGTGMFIVDDDGDAIYQYDLTDAFDLFEVVDTGNTFSDARFIPPTDVNFSPDGKTMFVSERNLLDAIYQYTLTNPFDFSVPPIDTGLFFEDTSISVLTAVSFSPAGTEMFSLDFGDDTIYQYTLTNPFDFSVPPIDTGLFFGDSLMIRSTDIDFTPDGKTMFVSDIDGSTDLLYQYDLTNPFDFSVPPVYSGISLPLPDNVIRAFDFSSEGDVLIMIGKADKKVYQYVLNAFDTVITADTINPQFSSSLYDDVVDTLSITFDEDVTGVDLTKIFVSDSGNINEISLDGASGVTIDSATVTIPLTSSQASLIDALTTPELDIVADAVVDLAGNPIGTTADNPISFACSISVLSGLSIETLEINEESVEASITITNDGIYDAQIFIAGDDWKPVLGGNVALLVDTTKYSTTSGVSYGAMTSLSATETDTGLVVSASSPDELYFKVQAILIDSGFDGDVTQDMTFTKICS